eukprot:1837186-Pyramimonas_sp.AAC.1
MAARHGCPRSLVRRRSRAGPRRSGPPSAGNCQSVSVALSTMACCAMLRATMWLSSSGHSAACR